MCLMCGKVEQYLKNVSKMDLWKVRVKVTE